MRFDEIVFVFVIVVDFAGFFVDFVGVFDDFAVVNVHWYCSLSNLIASFPSLGIRCDDFVVNFVVVILVFGSVVSVVLLCCSIPYHLLLYPFQWGGRSTQGRSVVVSCSALFGAYL